MSSSELPMLQEKADILSKEIKNTEQAILDEDDPETELVWVQNLESKQQQFRDVMEKIEEIQNDIRNSFVNKLKSKRNSLKNQNNDTFKIAKEDAIATLFYGVKLEPQEIASYFSSDAFIIQPVPGSQVIPQRVEYTWTHKFSNRFRDKTIPLTGGVKQPTYFCNRDNKKKKVNFFIERMYQDTQFINYCNEYFDKFNIKFSVEKISSLEFKIKYNLGPCGRLIFPQD